MTPAAATVLGLVLIAVGIPMIRNWMPRIGIEWLFMRLLALNQDVWDESHRRSGWDFVMLGAGLIALALWIARTGVDSSSARDFLRASVVISLVVVGVRSLIVTYQLARERDTIL